jgi:hypothetical protein
VIGEFEPKGRFLGNNFDQVAAVPYSTVDKYFPAPNDAPPWFPKRGELFLDAIAGVARVVGGGAESRSSRSCASGGICRATR